jgi:hypothetical protein
MKSDVRAKSLNGMRQIVDAAAASFSGLLWIFTGTPEFFDTNRGVKGLAAAVRPHSAPRRGRLRVA